MELNNNTTGSNTPSLYEACYQESQGSEALTLQCIAITFEEKRQELEASHFNAHMTSWLLVICGALVFFMQAGFAMVCAGCVRKKNVVNTMLKNLLDACAAAIAFYILGFGLAYGGQDEETGTTFCGNAQFFGHGYAFSAATVTIVAGTLAERCKMTAYFFYSIFLTGLVYPIVAHSVWSHGGFLSPTNADPLGGIGFIDAAGSGAIHVCGGVTALIAAIILGPRQGRFHDDEGNILNEPCALRGHSMAFQLLGTLVLWFGWYGFNGGSALLLGNAIDTGMVANRAAVNTTVAAATGALTAMVWWALTTGRQGLLAWDLPHAMNGALAGLVSVTSGCFTMDCWSAAVTGIMAGVLYVTGCRLLERFRIDDAVNAVPVHMFSGAMGVLATGLFSNPNNVEEAYGVADKGGLFFELGNDAGGFDTTLLRNQLYGLLFIVVWATLTTAPFFLMLNWMGWFRVEKMVEIGGLDAAYHAEERDRVAEAELKMAMEVKRDNSNPTRRRTNDSSAYSSSHRPKVVHFG
eukprot:scaffold42806_cov237-Amphora_coffeaeformis.AAC.5